MMGVPIEGAANALEDNDSVVKNSTIPTSTLHFVHESVTAKCIHIAYIPSGENLADMFTKPLRAIKLKEFCSAHTILM